jgi:hypothetical protein
MRAGFAAAAGPLPVLADPVTAAAASDGALAVTIGNGPAIPATVVGVLPRFPATGPRFVVADRRALAAALDARDPGTGSVVELWLTGNTAALATAPFDLLRVDLRQAREDRLAADPLALGASGLLASSALLAFVVALLALVLLVVAERRDESAQLYAWESDGVAPRTLRLTLFLRALAVTAVGVPGGILLGLLLSRITTALVLVTAVGATPVPPLVLAVTPLWTVLALGAGIAGRAWACAPRWPRPRCANRCRAGPRRDWYDRRPGARRVLPLPDPARAGGGAARPHPRHRGRRAGRGARPERLRQDHAAAGADGRARAERGSVHVCGGGAGRGARRRPGPAARTPDRLVDQVAGRSLRPEIPVLDNVALQLRLAGLTRRAARSPGRRRLDRLGLAGLADRWPATLSGRRGAAGRRLRRGRPRARPRAGRRADR